MGNRTEQCGHPPFINPSDNPYLHIVTPDYGKRYEYVANLHGLSVKIGKSTWIRDELTYIPLQQIEIPLLSPIETVPPPQLNTEDVVTEEITKAANNILSSIQRYPESNMLACFHGVYWGFLPEKAIAKILSESESKYNVSDVFPRIGGRKRIQEHAVLFK